MPLAVLVFADLQGKVDMVYTEVSIEARLCWWELKFHREAVKAEHTFEIDFAIRVLLLRGIARAFRVGPWVSSETPLHSRCGGRIPRWASGHFHAGE